MPTKSGPNAATASWRYICRAPNVTSRVRSACRKPAFRSRNESDGGKMAQSQSLQPQEKKELVSKDETTVPVRYFVPATDIFETEGALTVVMEVPGVSREALDINL